VTPAIVNSVGVTPAIVTPAIVRQSPGNRPRQSWLDSVSYTTGLSKSEVVRRSIKFAYAMVRDVCYRIDKEAEKNGKKLSPTEKRDRIQKQLEIDFDDLSNHERFIDDDDFVLITGGDVPMKMPGHMMDPKSREINRQFNIGIRTIREKYKDGNNEEQRQKEEDELRKKLFDR
jgi:hypothetical protein